MNLMGCFNPTSGGANMPFKKWYPILLLSAPTVSAAGRALGAQLAQGSVSFSDRLGLL